jgi:pimeloyl-ACP methyl ester carboxylesterase
MEHSPQSKRINSVALVHGGLVDGSGWRAVYDLLSEDGFNVSVVQNPAASLQGDVSVTKLALDEQVGPVVLVGHSYGGAVITEAGNHPKVERLVYITAFAPDQGESVNTFIAKPPPGAPVPPILPPRDGYLFLDKSKFAASFAADVDPKTAEFMAVSQVPWGVEALGGQITEPAWKTKPSWYLLVTDDRMIPIAAQRFMCERAGSRSTEVPGNHAIYVSNPRAVATIIQAAASAELAVR